MHFLVNRKNTFNESETKRVGEREQKCISLGSDYSVDDSRQLALTFVFSACLYPSLSVALTIPVSFKTNAYSSCITNISADYKMKMSNNCISLKCNFQVQPTNQLHSNRKRKSTQLNGNPEESWTAIHCVKLQL